MKKREEPFDLQPVLIVNHSLILTSDKIDGEWVTRRATEEERDEFAKEYAEFGE